MFPRGSGAKKAAKAGDSTKAACAGVAQVLSKQTLPVALPAQRFKARKITSAEREANVCALLRKAMTDNKLAGARAKRAADKAEEAAAKGKK